MHEVPNRPANTKESIPEYESPKIRVMDEKEVLQVFQITSAGATWWGM